MFNREEAFWLAVAILFMGFALWGGWHPHSIGWAISAFAFVGIIVSYRLQPAPWWERIAWVLISLAFVKIEFRAIAANDADAAATKQAQLEQFQTIIGELKYQLAASRNQYDSTITHVEGVLKETRQVQTLTSRNLSKVEEAINTETGGNAFCYLDFAPPLPQTGSLSAFDQTWISAFKVGRFPVYGVSFQIIDNEKANYLIQHYPMTVEQQRTAALTSQLLGNLGNEANSVGGYSLVRSENHDFQITISSFHAFSWSESFSMRNVDGKWKTALFIDVSGSRPATRGYYRIDDGYPLRDDGSPADGWRWPFNRGDGKWIHKLPPHI